MKKKKSQKLRKYLKKELTHFRKNAKGITRTKNNMVIIHDFRIAYKKMRAFVRLANTKSAEKGIKIPADFKDLYHRAGTVRRVQLYYANVLPYFNNHDHYPIDILENIRILKQQLDRAILKVNFHKAGRSVIRKAPERIPGKLLKKFIDNKTKSVRSIFSQATISDKQMHTVRKNLKDVMYIAAFSSVFLWKRLGPIGITSKKELKGFTDLLNNHQDYADRLDIISNTPSATRGDTNKQIIQEIRAEWEQEKELLNKCIVNSKNDAMPSD